MRKDKKAQMEIMGLAIIVILASLGMLFAIRLLAFQESPSEIKKTFTAKQLSANTVNTLLVTTTNCEEYPLDKILIACAEEENLPCISGACEYAESMMEEIFANTLDNWSKTYYFTVKSSSEPDPYLEIGNFLDATGSIAGCPGEKTSSSPCCVLPTNYEPIVINLDICG